MDLGIEPSYTTEEEIANLIENAFSFQLTEGVGTFLLDLWKKIKEALGKLWNWITGKNKDIDKKVEEKKKAAEDAVEKGKARLTSKDFLKLAEIQKQNEELKKINDGTLEIVDCKALMDLGLHLLDEAMDSLKSPNGKVDIDSFNKRFANITSKKVNASIATTLVLVGRGITDLQDKCAQDITTAERFAKNDALTPEEIQKGKDAATVLQTCIPKIVGHLSAAQLAIKAHLASRYDDITKKVAADF
jgi:hypothetical protein